MRRPSNNSIAHGDDAAVRLNPKHVVAVLGMAMALRLLVIWTVVTRYPPQWLFTRGMEMGLLAKSLLAGKGLSSPFGGDTGPTAIVAPVYPMLVAAVFKIFGEYSLGSAIVILGAQTIVNLVTIWLVMYVARRLFNQSAATISGMVWACSLPLVWMPTILWETSLSCCLLVGLIAIALRYRTMPGLGPLQWMTLGGYCGICALVNPALLLTLAGVALWLVYATGGRQSYRPLLSLLTFVMVFAPWPVRNARVFHAFVPLRTTVGLELWMGNRQGATGYLDESVFPMFNRVELADYTGRGEIGYSAHKAELARRYIASHPREFVLLTVRRFFRFWSGTGTENGSWLFALHATGTTVFAVIALGLLAWRRQFETLTLFLVPMILFPIPYLITHAEFRYRLVIDPVITIAAGFAVAELWRLLAQSRSAVVREAPGNRAAWRPV